MTQYAARRRTQYVVIGDYASPFHELSACWIFGLRAVVVRPVSLLATHAIAHFLQIVSDVYTSLAAFCIRITSWQKLAWLADPTMGPRANPSAYSRFNAALATAVEP